MQFTAPVDGNEASLEIWVKTLVERNGARIHHDCPDDHDASVGIRVIGKSEKIKAILEHKDGIQSIKPALEAYMNTLEASLAGIGIPEDHLHGTDEHTSLSDRFYYNVLLSDARLRLKIIDIETFCYGSKNEGRGVMHHLRIS